MRCPRCGRMIDFDTNVCLNCGYKKREKHLECPECGEPMVRGVCYRCGYRTKKSRNTCPFCRQKLIKGYCERCNYKKMSSKTFFFWIFLLFLIVAVLPIMFR